jgi:hypothetical protein
LCDLLACSTFLSFLHCFLCLSSLLTIFLHYISLLSRFSFVCLSRYPQIFGMSKVCQGSISVASVGGSFS